jgi:hypothetical protein
MTIAVKLLNGLTTAAAMEWQWNDNGSSCPSKHMNDLKHLMVMDDHSGCGNHSMCGSEASTTAYWYHLLLIGVQGLSRVLKGMVLVDVGTILCGSEASTTASWYHLLPICDQDFSRVFCINYYRRQPHGQGPRNICSFNLCVGLGVRDLLIFNFFFT